MPTIREPGYYWARLSDVMRIGGAVSKARAAGRSPRRRGTTAMRSHTAEHRRHPETGAIQYRTRLIGDSEYRATVGPCVCDFCEAERDRAVKNLEAGERWRAAGCPPGEIK